MFLHSFLWFPIKNQLNYHKNQRDHIQRDYHKNQRSFITKTNDLLSQKPTFFYNKIQRVKKNLS